MVKTWRLVEAIFSLSHNKRKLQTDWIVDHHMRSLYSKSLLLLPRDLPRPLILETLNKWIKRIGNNDYKNQPLKNNHAKQFRNHVFFKN